jgi:hypothetical protein
MPYNAPTKIRRMRNVTDLLLISDVPRLSTIFTRLTEDRNIRLRVATSLERGGEELAAEKPGIVFVQSRLSGLSADILLMHLKKLLERKRCKFVLLYNHSQAGEGNVSAYHGKLDISQDDGELLEAVKDLISSLLSKVKKTAEQPALTIRDISEITPAELEVQRFEMQSEEIPFTTTVHQEVSEPLEPPEPEVLVPAPAPEPVVPPHTQDLVEQGITYEAPRKRLSVYSEFNSSFDTAVHDIPPVEQLTQQPKMIDHAWLREGLPPEQPEKKRSKRTTFLLWMVPVVALVIIVTMLQHKRSQPPTASITPAPRAPVSAAPKIATAPPAAAVTPPVPSVLPVTPLPPAPVVVPAQGAKAAAEPKEKPVEKVVLSTSPEKPGEKGKTSSRPTTLPDFIPRNAQDKTYGTTNPGWERYKGHVTEFKVFRDGGTGAGIKAIQVVDRGGKGIPESFMKGVLKQLSNKAAFVKDTSEKKDGYEIQRGRVSENLSVVIYRDEQGGKLRGFVLTWL